MVSVDEAREWILDHVRASGTELVPLTTAAGRILARAMASPMEHPHFDNSAMDGYAVCWGDVMSGPGVVLAVSMEVPAGKVPGRLEPGTAAKIMTGAELPEGADTVIMREDTDESVPGQVTICALPQRGKGAHVRLRGENIDLGQPLFQAGDVLDGGAIGLLAMCGEALVEVSRRPRVAIISTGDELVDLGRSPGRGQLVNSSGPMVAAMVSEAGGEPWLLPIARDNLKDLRDTFSRALEAADLVVSIGGVSVGDFDLVKEVQRELCGGLDFYKVKMKPGKPLAVGHCQLRGTPMIGVPGNPVSTYVSFLQFVRPAIRRALGMRVLTLPCVTARLTRGLKSTPHRLDLQRGQLEQVSDGYRFTPFADQRSGNPLSLLRVGGLAKVPIGCREMAQGEEVEVEVIDVKLQFKL